MSVNRIDYLMFAADISDQEIDIFDFEEELNGSPNSKYDLVDDGMCGVYTYVGKILAKSDQYEGFENPIDIQKIIDKELNGDSNSLGKNKTIKNILKDFPHLKSEDFSLYLFTHWS